MIYSGNNDAPLRKTEVLRASQMQSRARANLNEMGFFDNVIKQQPMLRLSGLLVCDLIWEIKNATELYPVDR